MTEEKEIQKIKESYHWSHIWDPDEIREELINHEDNILIEKIINDEKYFKMLIKRFKQKYSLTSVQF